jgi:hypothetical protein
MKPTDTNVPPTQHTAATMWIKRSTIWTVCMDEGVFHGAVTVPCQRPA